MLRLSIFAVVGLAIVLGCLTLGQRGAMAVQRLIHDRIQNAYDVLGIDWVGVSVDGLGVNLAGHAPDQAAQTLAVETARSVAWIAEVTDATTATLAPPEHRDPVLIEMYRDGDRLTLTGRVYGLAMRAAVARTLGDVAPDLVVRDLTGTNAARPGRGWQGDLTLAVTAAAQVPGAYVRLEPGRVTVEGLAADAARRDAISAALLAVAPPGTALSMAIAIPAQVIAPFAFVAIKDPGGGLRIEACAVRSDAERAEVEAILTRAGVEVRPGLCTMGLGGPVGDWVGAIAAGLTGLGRLPTGRLALEYRAVQLLGQPPTKPEAFDAALADLRAALPEGFGLRGRVEADHPLTRQALVHGSYWMQMAHAGDGVLLSGLAAGEAERLGLVTYATALFGKTVVIDRLEVGPEGAPPGWQIAGLAGLAALAESGSGMVELADARFRIEGRLVDPVQAGLLDSVLRSRLNGLADVATDFTIDLPAAVAAQPIDPARCAVALNGASALRRIEFDPGAAAIDPASAPQLDALAAILARCPAARIEIGGHTDARGPEDQNQALSQARAAVVRERLIARGVAAERLVAVGYGEAEPVADNDSEAGRALNRRIAFRQIEAEP